LVNVEDGDVAAAGVDGEEEGAVVADSEGALGFERVGDASAAAAVGVVGDAVAECAVGVACKAMTSFSLASLFMTKTAPAASLDWAEARVGIAAPTPTANIRRLRVTFNICCSLRKTRCARREGASRDRMDHAFGTYRFCATVGVAVVGKVTENLDDGLWLWSVRRFQER